MFEEIANFVTMRRPIIWNVPYHLDWPSCDLSASFLVLNNRATKP